MGQQQFLLIVLGMILVGVAVVVSINIFTANSEETAKDAIISDTITLGAIAQQYFKRPKPLGGGSLSFANWSIPPSLDTTEHGTYEITTAGDETSIVITGSPTESRGYTWTVVTTITLTDISSVISS